MNKFPICPIFIPANKLTYVEKAIKSGADGIIFDLEDSILNDKSKARDNLFKYLSSNNPDAIIYMRINDLNSENGISDLEMLSELNLLLLFLSLKMKEISIRFQKILKLFL